MPLGKLPQLYVPHFLHGSNKNNIMKLFSQDCLYEMNLLFLYPNLRVLDYAKTKTKTKTSPEIRRNVGEEGTGNKVEWSNCNG